MATTGVAVVLKRGVVAPVWGGAPPPPMIASMCAFFSAHGGCALILGAYGGWGARQQGPGTAGLLQQPQCSSRQTLQILACSNVLKQLKTPHPDPMAFTKLLWPPLANPAIN